MTADVTHDSGRPESAWRVVAGREMSVKLRDRGFLASTLVTLALMALAIGLQVWLAGRADQVTVGTTGAGGDAVVRQATALARAAGQDDDLVARPLPDAAAVRAAVLADDVDAGLVPAGDGWQLVGRTDRDEAAATWIGAAVRESAVAANAAAAGTSLADLTRGADLPYPLLAPDDTPDEVARVGRLAFGFLFYLAAMMIGVSLATSVLEEKQNRIVEIIASSIRVRDLLIGKIVGNTVMGLAQMALFAAAGVVALLALGRSDDLALLGPGLGWFLVFYVLGIAVLACVFAAAGAMSTRSEDLQSTTTPVTVVAVAVFVAGISATGTLATVLSYVPLASTIVMPGRIVAGDAAWWEPLPALLLALAAAVAVVLVSERIYRRALLRTGGRVSLRQVLRTRD